MGFARIDKTLEEIYCNSLSIVDKLVLSETLHSQDVNNDLVNEWKNILGSTNIKFFETRVKWSNYNDETIRFLCSSAKFTKQGELLPKWLTFWKDFTTFIRKNKTKINNSNMEIPFYDILEKIAEFAALQIRPSSELAGTKVHTQLKQALISKLSYISQQTFLEEMYGLNIAYKDFCYKALYTDLYLELLRKYPVLAKLIGTFCTNWVTNTNELLSRIQTDKEILVETYGIKYDEKVSSISSYLSDLHNYNRGVSKIQFSGGKSIIYKPRNIDIEKAFFEKFIAWFNSNSTLPDQKILKVLPRNEYGWVEYVEHLPCKNKLEARSYYYRFGSLLSILHLLSATDYHNENLIASAGYPVIIDCETLLSPHINSTYKPLNKLTSLIDELYGNSVSRVGILPQWLMGPNGEIYDNSSLGSKIDYYTPYQKRNWQEINRDLMSFVYVNQKPESNKNVVYLNSARVNPFDYSDAFEKGFLDTYKYILRNRNKIRSVIKDSFNNLTLRFIFRPTKIYTLLQDGLLHPEYMTSGIKRSINIDYLSLGLLGNLHTKFRYWKILEPEYEQMDNFDVPYFGINSSFKNIYSEHKLLFSNCLRMSGVDQVLHKLNNMSRKDLTWQLKIISNLIKTKKVIKRHGNSSKNHLRHEQTLLTKEQLIKEAMKIGNDLNKKALISTDRRCTWVSYVSNLMDHSHGYKPIGYDLANGNMGTSLFLFALFSVTHNKRFQTLGQIALEPIYDVLKYTWSRHEFVDQFGIGITSGVSSIIYGLLKIYEITKNQVFLNVSEDFRDLITNPNIKASLRQDVVSGTAGCILALVKLQKLRPSHKNKELIDACVQNIWQSKIHPTNNTSAWEYQTGKCLTGFSHGASGIAYSLSKVLDLSNKQSLNNLINSIIAFETSNYSSKYNNWADYRFENVRWDSVSWCHGATGVGFSRLGILGKLDNTIIRNDLNKALTKTRHSGVGYIDTLCCGNFGKIDLLLTSGIKLKDDNLAREAQNMATEVISRRKHVSFNLFKNFNTQDINVGFFQGISGIGYELLRLAYPDRFKSVLMFE